MGAIEFLIVFMVFMIGICGTIFWIWALIDCATNESSVGNDKVVWVVIIAVTHWVGALIYLLVRRPKRIEEAGH